MVINSPAQSHNLVFEINQPIVKLTYALNIFIIFILIEIYRIYVISGMKYYVPLFKRSSFKTAREHLLLLQ